MKKIILLRSLVTIVVSFATAQMNAYAESYTIEQKNIEWGGKYSPPDRYYKLAKRFSSLSYEPNKWLKAAKVAGFNYVVLTTKRHDGSLWYNYYKFNCIRHGWGTNLSGIWLAQVLGSSKLD